MTAADALAVSYQDSQQSIILRLREMRVLLNELELKILDHPAVDVITTRIEMKAKAIADATEILNAVAHAQRTYESRHPRRAS